MFAPGPTPLGGSVLTPPQAEVAAFTGPGTLALRGLPGTGKTTALQACLAERLAAGQRPDRILVMVPQRAHVLRYEEALRQALVARGAAVCGGVDLATFYGFCQRQVALFWPLIAAEAGFAQPDREPVFLTIETTQYYMWRVVAPLIARHGYFSELAVRRGRLLSQLIDNLNKSALVGFDHREIAARLSASWTGSSERLASFQQAQDCATRFRTYCLEHGLLDFSLVCDLFTRHLLRYEAFATYFGRYECLVVDNLEENVPAAHDLIRWAAARCPATLLAVDEAGGYRVFLGADHDGALELAAQCERTIPFHERAQPGSAAPLAFAARLCEAIGMPLGRPADADLAAGAVVDQGGGQLWISMIRWVAEQIGALVERGVPPSQIAVVAPYVSDVMRFVLEDALSRGERPVRVLPLRPALALRDEPLVRGILALARLAHPAWRITIHDQERPLRTDEVALGLQQALAGLDPVRAHQLAGLAYEPGVAGLADLVNLREGDPRASKIAAMWERVGFRLQAPYEALRRWMVAYLAGPPDPLDVFLARLFGDVLALPGLALHADTLAARVYGRLVESAAKFRQAVGVEQASGAEERVPADAAEHGQEPGVGHPDLPRSIAEHYVSLLLGGIASAEYVADAPQPDEQAVVLAPAYAYLTRDLSSMYQFWVDLASDGWWNRPNQPLTHPYVLSRRWPAGHPWTDADEDSARRRALAGVLVGLASRCTGGIYLASSQLGIGGEEQTGRLERAILAARTR